MSELFSRERETVHSLIERAIEWARATDSTLQPAVTATSATVLIDQNAQNAHNLKVKRVSGSQPTLPAAPVVPVPVVPALAQSQSARRPSRESGTVPKAPAKVVKAPAPKPRARGFDLPARRVLYLGSAACLLGVLLVSVWQAGRRYEGSLMRDPEQATPTLAPAEAPRLQAIGVPIPSDSEGKAAGAATAVRSGAELDQTATAQQVAGTGAAGAAARDTAEDAPASGAEPQADGPEGKERAASGKRGTAIEGFTQKAFQKFVSTTEAESQPEGGASKEQPAASTKRKPVSLEGFTQKAFQKFLSFEPRRAGESKPKADEH
jgi:hypothetical protein